MTRYAYAPIDEEWRRSKKAWKERFNKLSSEIKLLRVTMRSCQRETNKRTGEDKKWYGYKAGELKKMINERADKINQLVAYRKNFYSIMR